MSDNTLKCPTIAEWTNSQGSTIRKVQFKAATLRIIRNDLRELFVEISQEKTAPVKLKLKSFTVHKKFMQEGKATIKFNDENCTISMRNAPPAQLVNFLRVIFVKMTGEQPEISKEEMRKKIQGHMLSNRPNDFDDISPVTNNDLNRARNLATSKATVTTPSPPNSKKRRLEPNGVRPVAKKLYNPSPLLTAPVTLNDEQNQVMQACLSGRNVFFTGSAGTGKSFLLRKIIATLPPDSTIATASTGVAACLINGVTLHSFAGIASGEGSLKRCFELASRPIVAQTWRKCKQLIIDEISMVDGEFFEKIEEVARYVRRNDKPFGGIQLILCGDFLQLPPVIKRPPGSGFSQGIEVEASKKRFCFQSSAWEKCIEASFELQSVHRQKDENFVKILNSIRIGRVTPEMTETLLATSHQIIESNGILATQLCSHTSDSDVINQSKLDGLTGDSREFMATDSDPSMAKMLDAQCPAPAKLVLKIGAQVMLLKNINISDGLVNGARGVVVKYTDGCPMVKFKNNREHLAIPEKWTIKMPMGAVIIRKQVPLKLAWAFSIHKSQGLTLDCVEMSLSKVFEAGQAYVALSRAQSLKSVRILDFDARQCWANPDVLQYYRIFRRRMHDTTLIPLGAKNVKKSNGAGGRPLLKKALSDLKLTKMVMSKPLVSIS